MAAALIMAANLLDGVDGAVARLTHTTSQFGVEFDSLADVVSFGVAPAVLVYIFALAPWGTWGGFGAALFAVCGALRLARFNVQTLTAEKSYFTGMPIPAAAGMVAATVFMYLMLGLEDTASKPVVFVVIRVRALAGLMVSNFRYSQLQTAPLQETQHHLAVAFRAGSHYTDHRYVADRVVRGVINLHPIGSPVLGLLAVRKRRRGRAGTAYKPEQKRTSATA